MNPITLYVLNTIEGIDGLPAGHRSYLFTNEQDARAAGKRLKAIRPREVDTFFFVVVPLEGAPS